MLARLVELNIHLKAIAAAFEDGIPVWISNADEVGSR